MKKPKRFKKLKAPQIMAKPIEAAGGRLSAARHGKSPEEKVEDALSSVPRITNETVSEHREEVLSSARKYIYPLQHSKHRVVRISLSLLALVLLAFFAFCGLELYKFQNTGGFIYDVTRIVPFPVAKTHGHFISYESYLFELRRNIHYYQTQQQSDFKTDSGKFQLKRLKEQAMSQVVQDAYVKQLAAQNGVSVSSRQVSDQLNLVRRQNRLGSNNRVFKEVLNEFWGWNENDFKRELRQQLLKQAVVAKLDTQTATKANNALKQLRGGADFAQLAGQVSEDPSTKAAGGQYPAEIAATDRELAPNVTDELFKLKPGQVSPVINSGYTLEILKVLDGNAQKVHAAHIQFNLKDASTYVKPLQDKEPVHKYIKV
jgi:hypothetical protein